MAPRIALLALFFCCNAALASMPFTISSTDMANQKPLAMQQVFNKAGCNGSNQSPQISWQHAPTDTKSFAVTLYDPDAPTTGGWWHWIVLNIPAGTTTIPTGTLPTGSEQARNDFGEFAYGGACPPPGDKPHHYILTVWALDTDKLPVTAQDNAAQISLSLNSHKLAKASLTATYQRQK